MESEIYINKHSQQILHVWYTGNGYDQVIQEARHRHGRDPIQTRIVAMPVSMKRKKVWINNMINHVSGMTVSETIVQASKLQHTQKNMAQRMHSSAEFNGTAIRGRGYIIVDDVIARDWSISELRHYIESDGSKVVGFSSLLYSKGSGRVALQDETLNSIKNRFDENELGKLLQEYNVSGTIEAITDAEGKYLLKFGSVDAIRNRFAQENAPRSQSVLYAILQGSPSRLTKDGQNDLRNTEKRSATESKPRSPEEQKLREAFDRVGWKNTGTIKLVKPITNNHKALQQIGRLFNQRVVLWKSTDDSLNLINGVVWFWRPGEIHTNSSRARSHLMSVVRHEVHHTLKNNHPDLYEFLESEISANAPGFQEYLADFTGDQFLDPEFWDKMNGQSPSLTRRTVWGRYCRRQGHFSSRIRRKDNETLSKTTKIR